MIELLRFRSTTEGLLIVVLVCRGEMDLTQSSALRDLFAALLTQEPKALIIDVSCVSYLDESIAVELLRLPAAAGASRVRIFCGRNRHVRRMLSRNPMRSVHRSRFCSRPEARAA